MSESKSENINITLDSKINNQNSSRGFLKKNLSRLIIILLSFFVIGVWGLVIFKTNKDKSVNTNKETLQSNIAEINIKEAQKISPKQPISPTQSISTTYTISIATPSGELRLITETKPGLPDTKVRDEVKGHFLEKVKESSNHLFFISKNILYSFDINNNILSQEQFMDQWPGTYQSWPDWPDEYSLTLQKLNDKVFYIILGGMSPISYTYNSEKRFFLKLYEAINCKILQSCPGPFLGPKLDSGDYILTTSFGDSCGSEGAVYRYNPDTQSAKLLLEWGGGCVTREYSYIGILNKYVIVGQNHFRDDASFGKMFDYYQSLLYINPITEEVFPLITQHDIPENIKRAYVDKDNNTIVLLRDSDQFVYNFDQKVLSGSMTKVERKESKPTPPILNSKEQMDQYEKYFKFESKQN